MNSVFQTSISSFLNAKDNQPREILLLSEIEHIKNGKTAKIVEECRYLLSKGEKDRYNKLKASLPAVTFSGTFSPKRSKDNCTVYSKLIIIDLDHIEKVIETKNILSADEFTFGIWISPSGKGLKLLVKVESDKDSHKYAFDALSDYYTLKYQIDVDKSGSDITRLCFTSYDPDICINPDAKIWQDFKVQHKIVKTGSDKKNPQRIPLAQIYYRTEGKNDPKNRSNIKKIIAYLTKNNKSITSTYDNWYRVALAMATSFTPDIGIRHYLELCRLDKENHNEEESQSLIEYCYRNNRGEINFSTIIHLAKAEGFIIK